MALELTEYRTHIVASGAFGESAFNGGKRNAVVGLLFHFCIAFTAAAVYYATSRGLTSLLRRAFIGRLLYGDLFMSFAVIPLSRIPKRKLPAGAFVVNLRSTCL
jgi:hypothetical protein